MKLLRFTGAQRVCGKMGPNNKLLLTKSTSIAFPLEAWFLFYLLPKFFMVWPKLSWVSPSFTGFQIFYTFFCGFFKLFLNFLGLFGIKGNFGRKEPFMFLDNRSQVFHGSFNRFLLRSYPSFLPSYIFFQSHKDLFQFLIPYRFPFQSSFQLHSSSVQSTKIKIPI